MWCIYCCYLRQHMNLTCLLFSGAQRHCTDTCFTTHTTFAARPCAAPRADTVWPQVATITALVPHRLIRRLRHGRSQDLGTAGPGKHIWHALSAPHTPTYTHTHTHICTHDCLQETQFNHSPPHACPAVTYVIICVTVQTSSKPSVVWDLDSAVQIRTRPGVMAYKVQPC